MDEQEKKAARKAAAAKYMREWRKTHREEYNAQHKAYCDRNREKLQAYDREWRQKNLEHARAKDRDRAKTPKRKAQQLAYSRTPEARRYVARYALLRKFGLSSGQFDSMLIAQIGRCGICNNPFEGKHDPAVDHCHASGAVRELLCSRCNIGLGHFKDSPQLLERAAAYLCGKE